MAVMLNTLPSLKFNIGPQKRWLGDDPFLLRDGLFSGPMLNFRGVICHSCGILDGLIHPVPPLSKVLVFRILGRLQKNVHAWHSPPRNEGSVGGDEPSKAGMEIRCYTPVI